VLSITGPINNAACGINEAEMIFSKSKDEIAEARRAMLELVTGFKHEIVRDYDNARAETIHIVKRVEAEGVLAKVWLGQFVGRLLYRPLWLAEKCSGWLANHGYPILGWVAIVLIIGLSGFLAAGAVMALLGAVFGHMLLLVVAGGIVGGISVDWFIVGSILEVARH
jgi:hypothetical protein